MQLLHTDAPAALYWLTPHMTAAAFMAPPGQAYPAVQRVAMEELVAQVYPAGPAITHNLLRWESKFVEKCTSRCCQVGSDNDLQYVMSTSHRYSAKMLPPQSFNTEVGQYTTEFSTPAKLSGSLLLKRGTNLNC